MVILVIAASILSIPVIAGVLVLRVAAARLSARG